MDAHFPLLLHDPAYLLCPVHLQGRDARRRSPVAVAVAGAEGAKRADGEGTGLFRGRWRVQIGRAHV